jgi:hypothetical protein
MGWAVVSPAAPATATIDTANKYLVSRQGPKILILRSGPLGSPLTDADALALAAWLVAMVDPEDGSPTDRFAAVLRAIRNT